MNSLTKEQTIFAIKLANMINCDVVELEDVLCLFSSNKEETEKIVMFWAKYNKDTQRALDTLVLHKSRLLLEKCLTKEASDYID